jgi:hypothetical protein
VARSLPKLLVAVLTPGALYAIACGPGGGSKTDSGIHLVPDSSKMDASGSGMGTCTAAASYPGAIGSNGAVNLPAVASGSNAHPHIELFDGLLNTESMPDDLHVELWAQSGGFGANDIKTGTYQITGAELNYETCGICVFVNTDLHQSGSDVAITDNYLATSGSVTLTSVGTNGSGTLAGSISNVMFTHVTLDPNSGSSTPVGDCNTMISSATFSATLQAGMFQGTSAPLVLRNRHR